MNGRTALKISAMAVYNPIHNGLLMTDLHRGITCDIAQKVRLKLRFIGPVQGQRLCEGCIMGIGKGISSIMDQFSKGVIVIDVQLIPAFQAL